MKKLFKALLYGTAISAMALALVACNDDDGAPAASASSSVSGTVAKGPINGATVTIYAVDASGVKGAALGTTTTGTGGTYSANVNYAGPVLIEASGGTYTDEATGTTKTLAETLRVMVTTTAGATVTGVVTPLTTAAYALGQVGGTAGAVSIATYGAAVNSIQAQFNLSGVNLVTTVPSVTGTVNGYGAILRAVSQFVANGGSLNAFLTWSSPTSFQVAFATAYGTINSSPITFSFNNDSVVISGTGVGGGSGQCGISGLISGGPANGVTFNYCVSGLPVSSCQSGNATLSTALNAASTGALGGGTIAYSFGPTCAANATPIVLAP
ncbi:MAG: hypothetical protein EOO28_30610 [Comamonadaceae bacterium]|nr:MAG: hypothetical protein EOO28_30610 [Comamonadaceae bacterium]